LSHYLKPFQYLEGDTLIKLPLSPARGELLFSLTLSNLDTFTMKEIYQSAIFESADLQNMDLSGVH
jgi:hypothetical protein